MQEYKKITDYLKDTLSGYRLDHTLSVEKESRALCDIFGITGERKEKISCGALLHDITKPLSLGEHIEILRTHNNDELISEITLSPEVAHAFTGALVAAKLFPASVDKTIENAIRYHTTGREDMTLEEKIIYLADYIEPTRPFEACRQTRKFFYDSLRSKADNMTALDKTLLFSLDLTIKELIEEGAYISDYSTSARNYLITHISD